MNDSPGDCQNREVTEPQRDGGCGFAADGGRDHKSRGAQRHSSTLHCQLSTVNCGISDAALLCDKLSQNEIICRKISPNQAKTLYKYLFLR
jgi:hypothetical protein